jgi:hypothetical protein
VRWPLGTSDRNLAQAGKRLQVAVCGLLAAAQVLAFSHAALVAHRICATHGEVVHAGTIAAPSRQAAVNTTTAGAQEAASEHQHDHCLIIAGTRERTLTTSSSPDGRVALTPARPHPAPSLGTPSPGRALWSLAPKNSPPVG